MEIVILFKIRRALLIATGEMAMTFRITAFTLALI